MLAGIYDRFVHIRMIKKRLADGSDCRKCVEATDLLKARGLWDRIDEVVWAEEGQADSVGMQLALSLGVDRAPFFVVRDDQGEHVYTSLLVLLRDRLQRPAPHAVTVAATSPLNVASIDVDDVGGI
jgi:hypothetical protein